MDRGKVLKLNKHALFKFNPEDIYEAGVVLTGKDVKDFKSNNFEIRDSLIRAEYGEIYVYNINLQSSPDEQNKRKLLLNKKEIAKIIKSLQEKRNHGFVIKSYINSRGIVKLEIGIGTIKKKFEKKASEKRSSEKRQTEKYISEYS